MYQILMQYNVCKSRLLAVDQADVQRNKKGCRLCGTLFVSTLREGSETHQCYAHTAMHHGLLNAGKTACNSIFHVGRHGVPPESWCLVKTAILLCLIEIRLDNSTNEVKATEK